MSCKDHTESAVEHTDLELGGEAEAGDKILEMLLKACGARQDPRGCVHREKSRAEHKGTL